MKYLIPILLFLPACGEEDATATSMNEVSTPPLVATPSSLSTAVSTPNPVAPKVYEPPRGAEFHFENADAITDGTLKDFFVELNCAIDGQEVGVMYFEMWGDAAPKTVRNFLRYCDEGFYDGLTFHRILRDFMVQGGDPRGTGAGDGPHGNLTAEFSDDPARAHGYGVLSMARGQSKNSASSQFFIICDEQPSVWNLDGSYASFGRLTSGVAALEKLASTPTKSNGREKADPLKPVTITSAVVKKGAAPQGREKLKRAAPPLPAGQPAEIIVQHILISFKGTPTQATRSKEEAEVLVKSLMDRIKGGEDFESLLREYTDDPIKPGDDSPGTYRMLNFGRRDRVGDRAMYEVQKELKAFRDELSAQIRAKKMTMEAARAAMTKRQESMADRLPADMAMPREDMVPAFGDVGFPLSVGGIGLAPFDPKTSKFGWHIIRRVK